MDQAETHYYEFGSFRLNPRKRTVTDEHSEQLDITAKAFDTLVYFLEHPGVVIDRSTLLDELWPGVVVEENSLSQTVASLRRLLGDGYIVTVRRRGYQFVQDVCIRSTVAGEVATPRSTHHYVRFLTIIVAAIAVTISIVFVSAKFIGDSDTRKMLPKVAVLPCDNLSPNPDDAYLALSLHQEILDQLGKLSGLLVISRSSVMQYAGNRPSIPEIAEVFDAVAVMECSVRYSGSRVVVAAQLIDPETDTQLWSRTYPGNFEDVRTIVAIQADIAMGVADSFDVEYLPAERQRLDELPTFSMAAYADFLKAREAIEKGGYSLGYSSEEFHSHIDQAIDTDPEFASAYSHRAFGYISRAFDTLTTANVAEIQPSEREIIERELFYARRDATEALGFDPKLGRAYAVLGAVELLLGKTDTAWKQFGRAIELSRRDAEILSFVTGFYLLDGRHDDVVKLLAQIKRLNPIDLSVGYFFYATGDRDTAREILRRLAEIDPADAEVHELLGFAAAISGDATEAELELRLMEELLRQAEDASHTEPKPGTLSGTAYAYRRIGLDDDAHRIVNWFLEIVEGTPVPPMRWAEIYLAIGDVDQAYQYAATASETPLLPFVSLELDFVLNAYNDPLFEEPRFVELRRKLGGTAITKL